MNSTKRRTYGDGSLVQRGENSWRLRYRVGGKRFSATVHGTRKEALAELRRLLRSGDTGEHVAPAKITLAEWIERWLALLDRQPAAEAEPQAGARRRGLVNRKTLERYGQLMRLHVVPTLGARLLQAIRPDEIDRLYCKLETKLAPRTVHHVHTQLGACFKAAVRKGLLATNPVARAEAPSPGDSDHGTALDAEQLEKLIDGFRASVLYPIICVAAFTGARRGEVLALRWSDFDPDAMTLRIVRSVEQTRSHGIAFKEPKTARGRRTITIDENLVALLRRERDHHLRIVAGVPDGATVDLSLVPLPEDALMFPNPPTKGESFSFRRPRAPDAVTQEFTRKAAALGFPGLRLHDLRGTHETMLLDAGVPVHVVAARCGHDPAVLLRIYAKRTRKADTSAAAVIAALSRTTLGS
ncbi:tyrosine-type recombinase/integrase [Rhodoplanes sp. SY1]|uniref:tyrosine-type recombinase/integrase n=1 Tax=Rhodoplanes sp. SY1 TaxID=3166646 RepID=UPI0038B683FE